MHVICKELCAAAPQRNLRVNAVGLSRGGIALLMLARELSALPCAGQLVLSTRGWFGVKDTIVHAGEGPVHAIACAGPMLAWANDVGVKVRRRARRILSASGESFGVHLGAL